MVPLSTHIFSERNTIYADSRRLCDISATGLLCAVSPHKFLKFKLLSMMPCSSWDFIGKNSTSNFIRGIGHGPVPKPRENEAPSYKHLESIICYDVINLLMWHTTSFVTQESNLFYADSSTYFGRPSGTSVAKNVATGAAPKVVSQSHFWSTIESCTTGRLPLRPLWSGQQTHGNSYIITIISLASGPVEKQDAANGITQTSLAFALVVEPRIACVASHPPCAMPPVLATHDRTRTTSIRIFVATWVA